eukprot:7788680-Pyramimonas_sp.AAC.1
MSESGQADKGGEYTPPPDQSQPLDRNIPNRRTSRSPSIGIYLLDVEGVGGVEAEHCVVAVDGRARLPQQEPLTVAHQRAPLIPAERNVLYISRGMRII